VLSI
jgi:hypothetical protein